MPKVRAAKLAYSNGWRDGLEGGFFEHSVSFQSQRSLNKLCNHDAEPLKPGEKTPTNKQANKNTHQKQQQRKYRWQVWSQQYILSLFWKKKCSLGWLGRIKRGKKYKKVLMAHMRRPFLKCFCAQLREDFYIKKMQEVHREWRGWFLSIAMQHIILCRDALSWLETLSVMDTLLHPPVTCCCPSPSKAWSSFSVISEFFSFAAAAWHPLKDYVCPYCTHCDSLQKPHAGATSAYSASGLVDWLP